MKTFTVFTAQELDKLTKEAEALWRSAAFFLSPGPVGSYGMKPAGKLAIIDVLDAENISIDALRKREKNTGKALPFDYTAKYLEGLEAVACVKWCCQNFSRAACENLRLRIEASR